MRTIKELLILMKDKYKETKDIYYITGFCSLLYYLRLTCEEEIILLKYMSDNRPNVKHYYTCDNVPTNYDHQFWYKISDKLNRYRWLNKHIKLNS